MTTKIDNATISRVQIYREDHGILTMMLDLEGDGWGVGFGGYALDSWDEATRKRQGHAMLAQAILELFDVFGVHDVSKLKGLPCRAETEGWGGRAVRIGHFTKDRWFSWHELVDRMKAAADVS